MNEDKVLNLTKQLVAIESTASNNQALHEAIELVIQAIVTSGKDITVEQFESNGKPSILAYRGPVRPDNFRIIFNGHVDVVAGHAKDFKVTVKDGKLYGRGVYDMKAAVAVMVDVFCEFVDKVPYPIALQIVSDEEIGGYDGTHHQIQHGVRGDFVICGECGASPSLRTIANEAKGVVWANIGFHGSSAHAGYLWKGTNAVLAASSFAQKILERYPTPEKPEHVTTVNVSSIETGVNSQNQVPDFALLKLDIRYTAQDPNFRSRKHLAALIEEIDPKAEVISIPIFDAPLYSSPKNPLLLSLKAAAEKVEGTKFKLVVQHASSDGRFYGNMGDQACEFGIAGEHQHGSGENVTIKAIYNYHATLREFLNTTLETEVAHTRTAAFNG